MNQKRGQQGAGEFCGGGHTTETPHREENISSGYQYLGAVTTQISVTIGCWVSTAVLLVT